MRRLLFKPKAFAPSLATASLVLAGCTATKDSGVSVTSSAEGVTSAEAALVSEITVFRSPTRGCCGQWIEHARAAGFQVKDEIAEDMSAIKRKRVAFLKA